MQNPDATPTDRHARAGPEAAPARGVVLASDLLPAFDFIALYAAASGVANWFGVGAEWPQETLLAALLAPFILYDKRFGSRAGRGSSRALIGSFALRFVIFTAVLLVLGVASGVLDDLPRGAVIVWIGASLLLTVLARWAMARQVGRLSRSGRLAEVVAVVGAGAVADRLVQALHRGRPDRIEVLGIFDDAGDLSALLVLARTRRIDWIVLTLPPTDAQRLQSLVQRLEPLGVPIGLCPQHVGTALPHGSVGYVGGSVPLGLLVARPIARWHAVSKTGEDVLIGGCLTLLLLPALALIALAVRLDSPGPVLFRQRRHGVNNDEFDIYKFRTMRWTGGLDGEALTQTARRDDRVTRVGRFLRASSLDELPQLFNVLEGSMSLVGPRPHATNMRTEDRLGEEITDAYAHRHRMKPGITGWAQVNGLRGPTHSEEQLRRRVEFDLHYIENWSLLLDLHILLRTPYAVFSRTNAY